MNKSDLEQFRAIGKEVRLERERMTKLRREFTKFEAAAVSVKGSLPYPPYTQHSVMVGSGEEIYKEYHEEIEALKQRIQALTQQRRDVRTFISNIQDSEMRQIFTLRYLEGKSWQQVAQIMGHEGDGSTERKRHDRYLKFP